MGEVIKANFGGKKVAPENITLKEHSDHLPDIKRSEHPEKISFENALFALQNLDKIDEVRERIDEITECILDRLQGYVKNDQTIQLRREGLYGANLEEIVRLLLTSSELDWKIHPSFYGALILEYQLHAEAALRILPEDGE